MSALSTLESSFIIVDNDFHDSKKPANDAGVVHKNTPSTHPSLQPGYKPGSASSYAHDWSDNGTGGGIHIQGRHFVDGYGRVCHLRGVNLSGCTKTPADHDHEQFPGDHRSVTFVGRPFPLEEAHEHFSRLRRWGLSFIRFLVTWEAVEHAGPGIYDRGYLSYIRQLLSLLPKYGLTAFVSMHQDVWSRYSGGSGAPAWTLEAAGFDLHAIEETGAGWLSGQRRGGHDGEERGIWPCGYQKLSAATMATLFWAGDTFAPKLKVTNGNGDEVSIQEFLQDAFLATWEEVAKAVLGLEGVIGFQMMNEPHRGYIELGSLNSFDYNTDLHLAHVPSAFQSFQLGAGHPTMVPHYERSFPWPTKLSGHTLVNTDNQKAWREDGPTQGKCLWEFHSVWGWDNNKNDAVILREGYFNCHPRSKEKVDWYVDFYFPFTQQWEQRVRSVVGPKKMLFLEPIPNEFCPKTWTAERRVSNMVYAPHWYDLNTLFTKTFGNFTVNVQGLSRGMFLPKALYWGQRGARDNFSLQLSNIVQRAYESLGENPVIIGECGIPMDMNNKEAFATGDFNWHSRMMDAMITGLERSFVGFTLWNYNPSNDDVHGDDWNGENFSWFSRSRALPPSLLYYGQAAPSLDNGGRILSSVVRPYPAKTCGVPIKFEYEMTTGTMVYEWANSSTLLRSTETEIYFPSLLAQSRELILAGLEAGDKCVYDESRQTLFVVCGDTKTPGKRHRIHISVSPGLDDPRPEFYLNDFWSDFGGPVLSIGLLLVLVLALYVSRLLQ